MGYKIPDDALPEKLSPNFSSLVRNKESSYVAGNSKGKLPKHSKFVELDEFKYKGK